ncbi:MAG: acylphosphatase [Candidatus Methylomirabilales bacterium]
MPRVRARVVISGKVQGVYFRGTAEDEGRSRGLAGWVRNRPDGQVEAVFEGEKAAVEAVIAWCHRGPPAARVTGVAVTWEEPRGEQGFSVRF